MNQEQIESQVMQDYRDHIGKVVRVKDIDYFLNEDSHVAHFLDGVLVRVLPGQNAESVVVWNDDYCDPIWEVKPLNPSVLPEGATSCWTHGISYRKGYGRTPDPFTPKLATDPAILLTKALLRDDAFSFMFVRCPECDTIEDEQYQCSTCERLGGASAGDICVADLVRRLIE
jgi:hypothetical protein